MSTSMEAPWGLRHKGPTVFHEEDHMTNIHVSEKEDKTKAEYVLSLDLPWCAVPSSDVSNTKVTDTDTDRGCRKSCILGFATDATPASRYPGCVAWSDDRKAAYNISISQQQLRPPVALTASSVDQHPPASLAAGKSNGQHADRHTRTTTHV